MSRINNDTDSTFLDPDFHNRLFGLLSKDLDGNSLNEWKIDSYWCEKLKAKSRTINDSWIKKGRIPEIRFLLKLCELTKTSIHWLLTGKHFKVDMSLENKIEALEKSEKKSERINELLENENKDLQGKNQNLEKENKDLKDEIANLNKKNSMLEMQAYGLLDTVKKILGKTGPPKGIDERRQCREEFKKFFEDFEKEFKIETT